MSYNGLHGINLQVEQHPRRRVERTHLLSTRQLKKNNVLVVSKPLTEPNSCRSKEAKLWLRMWQQSQIHRVVEWLPLPPKSPVDRVSTRVASKQYASWSDLCNIQRDMLDLLIQHHGLPLHCSGE